MGRTRLLQGIELLTQTYPVLPFDPLTVPELFLAHLPGRLQAIAQRALIMEMHIARLEGHLDGATPQARFQDFLRQICQPEQRRAFFQQYRVLARVMMTAVQLWSDFSLEFLDHLCVDWADICATFAQGKAPGQLAEVRWGAGDTHRNGKSVAIVSFSSGLTFFSSQCPLARSLL